MIISTGSLVSLNVISRIKYFLVSGDKNMKIEFPYNKISMLSDVIRVRFAFDYRFEYGPGEQVGANLPRIGWIENVARKRTNERKLC
jgi:hypothetical protein